jgi:4-amino-4-deoxy-L-arabinose transferase-like glycosyltransferase
MSGLFSVGSLGVMWALVHRVRGARTACYATALLATSPFTVRYATETRMYALVILLVLLGALAVRRAIEDPTVGRLVAVSLVSGALLLTHYWALYLVAATLAILANEARHRRPWAKRVTVAVAAGGIAFVPWLPSFVYQMRHTGAPWAQTATFGHVLDSLRAYAAPGALDSGGWLLWLALLGLVVLGVFASPRRRRSIELRWPGRAPARQLALITVGVLALALAIGVVTHSPVTSRYTAVVFPLVILLAALGLGTFGRTTALVVLTIATVSGLAGSADAARTARTEVPRVVATLAEQAAPGDLVVYCPDQLGPSTSRLIRSDVRQVTFPNLADPQRVDWVDYREHVDATDVETFAWQVNALAGTGDLWLVTAPNYTTMSPTCRALRHEIEALRPRSSELVTADGNFLEQAQLFRMRPNTAVTTAGS